MSAAYHPPSALFCRQCGHALERRVPDDGDTKVRGICPACTTIHYDNPLCVVGTVPYWGAQGEQVLLCLRNIEPRKGKWTLPAGFLELAETTAQGAARETDEEAGAHIDMGPLFSLMNVPRVGQVHLYYLARLTSDRFSPGIETQQARLFTEAEVPWDEIAFTTVKVALQRYFADRRAGALGFHLVDVD